MYQGGVTWDLGGKHAVFVARGSALVLLQLGKALCLVGVRVLAALLIPLPSVASLRCTCTAAASQLCFSMVRLRRVWLAFKLYGVSHCLCLVIPVTMALLHPAAWAVWLVPSMAVLLAAVGSSRRQLKFVGSRPRLWG